MVNLLGSTVEYHSAGHRKIKVGVVVGTSESITDVDAAPTEGHVRLYVIAPNGATYVRKNVPFVEDGGFALTVRYAKHFGATVIEEFPPTEADQDNLTEYETEVVDQDPAEVEEV